MQNTAPLQLSDITVAPGWAELGRIVRRRTFEAITLHFASIAEAQTDGAPAQCASLDGVGAEDRR